MIDREKIAELIADYFGVDPAYYGVDAYAVADHLLSNGVTFVTDNNVGRNWIPVGERKPDLIPCDAGTAYSEAVIVCTSGKKIMVAVWDGIDFLCDMDYWEAWGEQITHWVPIDWLLPLPELPKEDS